MIFIIFSFVFSIGCLVENKTIFMVVFSLCMMSYSITYGYSYDWINYYDTYELSGKDLTNYNFLFDEPGFYYISSFFSKLGFSFPVFLALVNLFNYSCLYFFISKTKQKFFCLLIMFSLYGYYLYAGGYRQAIAVSFDLLAIAYLMYDNSRKKFYILAIAGFLFHFSSIVVLIYPLLKKTTRYNFSKIIIIEFSIFIVSFIVLNNYTILSGVPYVGDKLNAYMLQFNDSGASFSSYLLGAKSILLYLVLFIYSLFILNKNDNSYMVPVGLMLLIISRSNPILLRFSFYFLPYVAFSLINNYKNIGKIYDMKINKLVFIISFLLMSTMFYWTDAYRTASNSNGYINDSKKDTYNLINEKCYLLSKYMSDQVVIFRCR